MTRLSREPNALFASDLDGTLAPVEADPSYPDALHRFRSRLALQDRLVLAYVTGRTPEGALNVVEHLGLPLPDVLCCDVGTRVLWSRDGAWRLDEAYRDAAIEALGGVTSEEVLAAFADETGFRPQEAAHQTPVKISFRLDASRSALHEFEAARAVLARRRWKLSLVASRSVYNDDVLLDVLPGGLDKSSAVHHVRQTLRLATDDVVYAGDSGNDLAPLTAGFRAVIVANADAGLASSIREFAAHEGRPHRIFTAVRPHLHGVLEGATYFGIF